MSTPSTNTPILQFNYQYQPITTRHHTAWYLNRYITKCEVCSLYFMLSVLLSVCFGFIISLFSHIIRITSNASNRFPHYFPFLSSHFHFLPCLLTSSLSSGVKGVLGIHFMILFSSFIYTRVRYHSGFILLTYFPQHTFQCQPRYSKLHDQNSI